MGQNALNLDADFYDQLLFIKRQMTEDDHPLRQIIEKFKQSLVKHCMVLLCKDTDDKSKEILAEATFEEK